MNFSSKSFPSHLYASLPVALNDNRYTDVILMSEDLVQAEAHRLVLSASSPVLDALLAATAHPHPLLLLRGVAGEELQALLQFVYQGEARIPEDRIQQFVTMARDLQVRDITGVPDLEQDHAKESVIKTEQLARESEATDKMEEDPGSYDDDEGREINCENSKPSIPSSWEKAGSEKTKNKDQIEISKHFNESEVGNYPCKSCDKIFFTDQTLNRHRFAIHMGIKYPCKLCPFQSARRDNMLSHKLRKHKDSSSSPTFKENCHLCDFGCNRLRDMKRHRRMEHNITSSGVTQQAVVTAEQLPRNQLEIEAIHSKGTEYNKKEDVKSEVKGIRYSCNHCSYQASRFDNLKIHLLYKHREGDIEFSEKLHQ